MGYNYGYNRKRMEKEFAEIAAACQKDGMQEENIEAIHRLMLDELNNDRRFHTHTQPYDSLQFADGDEADEGHSPLLDKFLAQLSVMQEEICEWGRMAWLDDMDTPEVIVWLKSLKDDDIHMLTLIVVDRMNQKEAAQALEKYDSAISRRMRRLREDLIKVLPERLKKRYII